MNREIYNLILPGTKFGSVFNKKKFSNYKENFIKFLLNNLEKDCQLVGFFYPISQGWDSNLLPLEDFLKLRDNKEAMKLIYELFLSLANPNENFEFDQLLKTNPDSELQSLFFLFLIARYIILNREDSALQIKNFVKDNFPKLDEKSKFVIIIQLLEYGYALNKIINEDEILDFIFENFYDIHKYYNGNLTNEEIDKVLNLYKEPEIQAFLFLFLLFKRRKFEDDFLRLEKETQIFLLKEYLNLLIIGPGWVPFFQSLDTGVLASIFYELTIDTPDEIYDIFTKLFENKEEEGFIYLSFELQMKILEQAQKDKKVKYFSLLPNKYRTRKTLKSLKDIDIKLAEKFIIEEKNETKDENNEEIKNKNIINSGLSKNDFKERLKIFNSNKKK